MGIPGADMHKIQSDKTRGSSVMSNSSEDESYPIKAIFILKSNLKSKHVPHHQESSQGCPKKIQSIFCVTHP